MHTARIVEARLPHPQLKARLPSLASLMMRATRCNTTSEICGRGISTICSLILHCTRSRETNLSTSTVSSRNRNLFDGPLLHSFKRDHCDRFDCLFQNLRYCMMRSRQVWASLTASSKTCGTDTSKMFPTSARLKDGLGHLHIAFLLSPWGSCVPALSVFGPLGAQKFAASTTFLVCFREVISS